MTTNVYEGVIVAEKPLGGVRHMLILSRNAGAPLLLRVKWAHLATILPYAHKLAADLIGLEARAVNRDLFIDWPGRGMLHVPLGWSPILARREAPDLASLQHAVILVAPRIPR